MRTRFIEFKIRKIMTKIEKKNIKKYWDLLQLITNLTQIVISIFLNEKPVFSGFSKLIGVQN